ncbi:MAG: glycosyltransferase [Xanthobacteraceae bacterium]
MLSPDRRKLKIAMVCDAVTDYLGGALVSTARFAEGLIGRGHSVIYITGKSPRNRSSGFHGPIEVFRFRSFPAPYFDGQFYLGLPTGKEIREILRSQNVDLVHILLPMPSGVVAARAARALQIPVVVHSHMLPEVLTVNMPRFVPKAWFHNLFYRYAHWFYGSSDAIVFSTEYSRQLFAALAKRCNTSVISNGVNADVFRCGETGDFFDKFRAARNKKNLLFVGRLHPEKGVETLIEAMPHIVREHADAHAIVVGSGSRRARLEQLAAGLGVASQVTFLGYVNDDDLLHAFNASDVFVLPSVAEIEPLVVLEAMACGKPLLVSDALKGISTSECGNGLTFETGNHVDLAAKACKLLADPAMLSAMGQRSHDVSRRYDIRESVAALETLYYSLLPPMNADARP